MSKLDKLCRYGKRMVANGPDGATYFSEDEVRELGKTHVVLSKELVGFLLGENDYQGKGMGDEPPVIAGKYKARYWWRKLIRSEIQASE